MKRISTLLLAGAMVFGAAGAAEATDVKVKGQFDFAFGWAESINTNNLRGSDDDYDDRFIAAQRLRTQVNFIASEALQGVVMFEIGTQNWGRHGDAAGRGVGAGLDADGVNVETKRAYLDWIIPDTDVTVRMGIQGLGLPMASGIGDNPVFDADVAAITTSYKIDDMFALTAFWARPFDSYLNDNDESGLSSLDDEVDMFGLIAPITGDGWSVTPWAVYAEIGADSGIYNYLTSNTTNRAPGSARGWQNENTEAWWAGTAFSLTMFDPLTFGMDVMYGDMHREDIGVGPDFGSRGWFVDAALNYKLDWGTPGLFGWWSSGDDKNAPHTGQYGRIPVVGIDSGYGATTFGLPGSAGIGTDGVVAQSAAGTWGVGAQIADMSFVENLSHTIRVAYYEGTNEYGAWRNAPLAFSGEVLYLTDKDHVVEVNFDHKYQIYENLAAFVELGYLNLDLKNSDQDDAWKAQVLFQYSF